ncbi:MAG: hypothetical protein AAFX78_14710 [Cyanobacteria bacterium J06638_20]
MVAIPDILRRRKDRQQFRSAPEYGRPTGRVDREQGIIHGVQIVREGEAKGHGVHLDSDFIAGIAELGNASRIGTKSRFNHPNMSAGAFGTMIGKFYNFKVNGTAVYADLHLSPTAKSSPNGDLHTYVLDMAENEPGHFGNSIAFSDDGNLYVKDRDGEKKKLCFRSNGWDHTIQVEEGDGLVDYDTEEYSEEVYVLPAALHASDLVDDPAATDGLFSASANSQAFAVQATAFLDAHPEIFGFIERHPDRLQPFFQKYEAYLQRKGRSKAGSPQLAAGSQEPTKPKMKKTNFSQRLYKAFTTGGTFDISVTDTEGNALSIVTESEEPAVGDEVTVVNESGETEPAAAGNYVVADGELEGRAITVAGGRIADITDPADDSAIDQPGDPTPGEVSMSALQDEVRQLKAENAKLRKRPATAHTVVDGEQDFSRSGNKGGYSFNEAGKKAHERGRRLARNR